MADRLPIPLEALEDCGAILGRRGAGKSATRTLLLEHELDRGRRCCLIDPKGDSWGIRLNPDRSPSRFQNVKIFGGQHADLALTDAMGAVLGKVVATHDLSCIIDCSAFSVAGMRRFMRDFAEALFENNRAALTLFVDEADQLAPQRLPADMTMLLHHMESLIRQGRQRGIFMWMLTQRPQVLNKNLLSQADSLVAMKMTTPHDRTAVRDWMEAHDPELAKQVLATLAKLAVGEAWAWVPAADFLERVQFPLFSTFDSMRTPRHGERVERVALPPIDMSAIAEALQSAAAPASGEDRAGGEPIGVDELVRANRAADEMVRQRDARIRALEDEAERHREQLKVYENLVVNVQLAVDDAREEIARLAVPAGPTVSAGDVQGEEHSPRPPARPNAGGGEAPKASANIEPGSASPDLPQREASVDLDREYKALAVLASVFPRGLTEPAWAARAGYARKGGAWLRRRARYLQAGLIEQDGKRWVATEAGIERVGEDLPQFPAPGPELVRYWAKRLGTAGGRILLRLADLYPQALNRAAIAGEVRMAEKGGAFLRAISEVKSAELVEERNKRLRIAPAVMEQV